MECIVAYIRSKAEETVRHDQKKVTTPKQK